MVLKRACNNVRMKSMFKDDVVEWDNVVVKG